MKPTPQIPLQANFKRYTECEEKKYNFFDIVGRKARAPKKDFARRFEEVTSHESTRKTPKPWLEFSFGAYKKNFKR